MHDTNLPTSTPTTLVAGDTWEWEISSAHYKASDGWTLTYHLVNSAATIGPLTAAADGDDHVITVAAATTAAYTVGTYRWESYATKGTERHRVNYGTLEITADLATANATDLRSHARVVLDAIEAVIEGRATQDQSAYSITTGNVSRSLSRTPMADLLLLRDRYRAEVLREDQAERIRKGLGSKRRILTRFS